MATFTCQILIGKKHSYDSGIINISHTLYLSENSRPALILSPTEEFTANKQVQQKITWIPTLENMLEDALVMIGLYVLKDQQLINWRISIFSIRIRTLLNSIMMLNPKTYKNYITKLGKWKVHIKLYFLCFKVHQF